MTGSLVAADTPPRGDVPARGDANPRGTTSGTTTGTTVNDTPPLLTVTGLSQSYGPVRALDGVNLSLKAGELVALAGEDRAGKTTLVRCIAGDMVPASGEIFLSGRRLPNDPAGVGKQGIAVVWQDLALCDNLDV